MKNSKLLTSLLLGASLASVGLVGSGCGAGEPSPKVESARVDTAKDLRTIFDKVKGDYAALTEADKAEFLRLCDGDATKVEQTWNAMKFGPGGAGASSSPQ